MVTQNSSRAARIAGTKTPKVYVWQQPGWPAFALDVEALAPDLGRARLQQGRLLGQIESIGMTAAETISGDFWVNETLATAAIEGEKLDLAAVRSSVYQRLGLAGPAPQDRHVEGLVTVMQDATAGYAQPLDDDRLQRWQAALFPNAASGLRRIAVGRYRDRADPMQIVSGQPGRETVHYQAPDSASVATEMSAFVAWFEATRPDKASAPHGRPDGLIRAALAHLWFESVHPFEDGNGRLGRALVDMAISQDFGAPTRLFGMARQMQASRKAYYDALNAAQTGGLDVTAWVRWFLQAFEAGCRQSQTVVRQAMDKSGFRTRAAGFALNERQRKVLDRLLADGDGGFLGGMTADKYGKMTGASKATATRDLADLLQHGLLRVEGLGKATRYAVAIDGWTG